MKLIQLVNILNECGYSLKRNGGSHDIYGNGAKEIAVPRHREINELLARKIIRDAGKGENA